MVADEDDLDGRADARLVVRNPLPVAFHDGRLRLEDDDLRCERVQILHERPGSPFLRDAVQPGHVVSGPIQHRRGGRGDHGEDVGRPRKPLELAVLREKRDALLARQRWIADCNLHG